MNCIIVIIMYNWLVNWITYLKESFLSDNFQWEHDHDQRDYDQEDASETMQLTKASIDKEIVLPPWKATRPQRYENYMQIRKR